MGSSSKYSRVLLAILVLFSAFYYKRRITNQVNYQVSSKEIMTNGNRAARQGASSTTGNFPAISDTMFKGKTPGAEHVVFRVGKDA